MASIFSLAGRAVLRGLAQLAFTDSTHAGALILLAIAWISPWSAAGAIAGAVIGTIAGFYLPTYSRDQWELGLSGYNAAIIGIIWGAFFASSSWDLTFFFLALSICIALESILLRLLGSYDLPILSLPAVLTAYVISGLYAVRGDWFWLMSPPPPLGSFSQFAAMCCVAAAMLTKSVAATLQVLVLSAIAAFLASLMFRVDVFALWGLWALTVAPASFGMHAVFLAGSTLGSFAGALAALTGAAIWTVWILSELDQTVPPLLLPFIAGTWISIVLLRYLSRSRLFQPSLWRAAEALTEARAKGGTTTVLIGAGANPSRDTPVRSGRSWSRAKSIRESCTMDDFKSTAYNRRAFWDACSQLRENAKTAEMDEVYSTLASMADKGWLKTVMTLSVDGRQRAAGLHDLIELQGQLDRVHCIDCNQSSDWPPKAIWQRYDIQCPSCSGLMKPAVSLSGEEVPLEIWQCANSAVRDCQVLMLIGIESTAASTMRLLEQARATGSIVVIVENDPPPIVVQAEDVLLYGAMRQDLAALAQILRYPRFVQFISRQVLTPLNQILVRRAKKNARRCTSNP